LALTSPTGGGRSVGIVRSRTKAMEFSFSFSGSSNNNNNNNNRTNARNSEVGAKLVSFILRS
jgi:hypothetical protein